MCLAVPLKITSINGDTATGEAIGLTREIRIDFIENPQIGDYVIVHAGFAIEKVSEDEARKDIEAWEDVQNVFD